MPRQSKTTAKHAESPVSHTKQGKAPEGHLLHLDDPTWAALERAALHRATTPDEIAREAVMLAYGS